MDEIRPFQPQPDSEPDPSEETFFDLKRYRRGDLEALNRLFERHFQRVVRVARSRLGFPLRRRVDVEDIVQLAFADAYRYIDSFEYRGKGSFTNWMAKLTENRAKRAQGFETAEKRDLRQEQALEGLRRTAHSQTARFDLPADEASVGSQVAREELVVRVEEALHQLPQESQEVIRLRKYADCTYGEIKEIMGLSNEEKGRRLFNKAMVELGRLLKAGAG